MGRVQSKVVKEEELSSCLFDKNTERGSVGGCSGVSSCQARDRRIGLSQQRTDSIMRLNHAAPTNFIIINHHLLSRFCCTDEPQVPRSLKKKKTRFRGRYSTHPHFATGTSFVSSCLPSVSSAPLFVANLRQLGFPVASWGRHAAINTLLPPYVFLPVYLCEPFRPLCSPSCRHPPSSILPPSPQNHSPPRSPHPPAPPALKNYQIKT